MAEKINENKPHDCFVAFLDIMGFKERLLREGYEKVGEMFKSLRPTMAGIEARAKSRFISERDISINKKKFSPIPPNNLLVSFSDSIILISSDASKFSALSILIDIGEIFSTAIESEIPLKGALAYGKMTVNSKQSLYFGTPLIDAVELQNELYLYGVVLHHTIEKYFQDTGFIGEFENTDIFKWAVPMKSGKIIHYIVDWTNFVDQGKDVFESVNKLYSNVSGKPRIYVDNTLEFLDWLKKEKAK